MFEVKSGKSEKIEQINRGNKKAEAANTYCTIYLDSPYTFNSVHPHHPQFLSVAMNEY